MEWPFVARIGELARLVETLATGQVAGVLLVGEAGVGKTRLAGELVAVAAARGRHVIRAAATRSARPVPFGALAHVVDLPEAPQPSRPALLHGVRRDLLEGAPAGGLVLAVDDAHHLDELSAALLHQLAAARSAFLVLTARSDERVPHAVTTLWKDELVERVDVGPLDRAATGELVAAALGAPAADRAHQRLWQLTHGNPLLVRELLRSAGTRGALHFDGARWQLRGPLPPSARLRELVAERTGHLDRTQQHALELVAAGEDLSVPLLERLSSARDLEALERGGLIEIVADGRRTHVRPAHPLYGEVVARSLPYTRRRRLDAQIAGALETTGARRRGDALRIATRRLDAGGTAAPALLVRAARQALAAFDPVLAERLADAALAAGGAVGARLIRAEAVALRNPPDEAERVLGAMAAEAGGDTERARIALLRADNLSFRMGQPDRAAAVVRAALRAVRDPSLRDELAAKLAQTAALGGDFHAAVAAEERILARPDPSPRAELQTLVVSSIAHAMLGQRSAALAAVERALPLADRLAGAFPLARDLLEVSRVAAAGYAGELEPALGAARAAYDRALRRGDDPAGVWGNTLAQLLLLRGQLADAARVAHETRATLRRRDVVGLGAFTTALEALVRAQMGAVDAATGLLAEVSPELGAADLRARIHRERAAAWIRAQRGETGDAARRLAALGTWALQRTHVLWAVQCLHDAVRLGRPALARARLESTAHQVEGTLIPALAGHARALEEGDPAALEAAAGQLEGAGARLLAAEALAQAAAGYQRARDARWRRTRARAAELARLCPGADTPALVVTSQPLTPREQQIARMAATGMTSPEIAERLEVSVRTVDNHLGSVYTKLGISGRGELAGVLLVGSGPPTR